MYSQVLGSACHLADHDYVEFPDRMMVTAKKGQSCLRSILTFASARLCGRLAKPILRAATIGWTFMHGLTSSEIERCERTYTASLILAHRERIDFRRTPEVLSGTRSLWGKRDIPGHPNP